MKALDLFCGYAGGATIGLQQAGFNVTGVDLVHNANHPADKLIIRDIEKLTPAWLQGYDFIWASPPCQNFSKLKHFTNKECSLHKDLIEFTVGLIKDSGKPGIIENVTSAPLKGDIIQLTGRMFGLPVVKTRNFLLINWYCLAPSPAPQRNILKRINGVTTAGKGRAVADDWAGALGIDTPLEPKHRHKALANAIPPAYAKYIGEQFILNYKNSIIPQN